MPVLLSAHVQIFTIRGQLYYLLTKRENMTPIGQTQVGTGLLIC